LIAELRKNI